MTMPNTNEAAADILADVGRGPFQLTMDRLSFNSNPSAGAQIVHSTPLGGYSSSTSPSNSAARFLWINRVPNPVRLGGKTGGPFLSRQRRRNSRPCGRGAKVQAISIYPSSFDNAPYLAALVPSSFMASPRASAGLAPRLTSGPFARIRFQPLLAKGARMPSMIV